MKIHEYNEMMSYLTRPAQPKNIKVADLADELTPGPLKDELTKDFDPSQESYEEYLQRKNLDRPFNAAQGGRANLAIGGGAFYGEELPNNREGFSKTYGPNIRLSTTGANTFEVSLKRGGKTYYKNFRFDDYGGKEKALKAANDFRNSVKDLPKETGKQAKGRPVGFKPETGQSAEIRRILNQFISEGKTSFSNKDVKELIDKDKLDLFETDRALITAIDRVKREPEFKDLNFVDARSLKEKGEYFTDSNVRKIIKENYGKVKQETLAKLTFPDEPLTTSKSRLEQILSDMVDKGEIKRLKRGEASEERLQDFDTSPESQKKSKIAKRRRKKIDILGSKEYEEELYEFKKQVQEGLGLEKVKEGKYDPIDMGHQSSITQLKALKQKLKPEDLNPQFYKANQLGIKKFEGGVKTLEIALDRNFYPEQKKLYNKAKKFINAGEQVPKDLQNKIIASNEKIQQFIDKTVEKYPLLKDRVNAVTVDPNDLTVRRGNNVMKQLGIGLVDQNLGDIEIGSVDDLTIKANLAEQTLKEAINADLIDEKIGRQKLNTFLKSQPLELEEVSNVQKVFRKMGNQLNSGMDPKLLVEYLGAEMKDLAAFGQKYGGSALTKVGKGITGIDLPIFQTLFASTYDIEQDSPLWLTLPAAFTDEVANIFNLYNKSEGKFGLGKVKDFGKFVASSFVPQVVRSPIFKAVSKVGKIGSLAAPLTEAGVQAYRFEKMKERRDDAIKQFNIPIEIGNRAFDNYIRSTVPQDAFDELNVPASPGLPGLKRDIQQLGSIFGLADDPYAIQKVRGDVTGTGLTSPMALQRLYDRQGLDQGGPSDPKRRLILKALGLIPATIAGIASVRFGPQKVAKVAEAVKSVPPYFFKLVDKIKSFGDDVTKRFATDDLENVYNYRTSDADYELYENIATGDKRIKVIKGDPDAPGYKEEELILTKGQADEQTGFVPDEYDEYTVKSDFDGKMKDIEDGLDDIEDLIEEIGPDNISVQELQDMGYDVNRLGPVIKKKLGIK